MNTSREQPGKKDFVKFFIDGVRLSDVEMFDELGSKLVSSRDDILAVRKETFYFCLFILRSYNDLMSQLEKRMTEKFDAILDEKIKALELSRAGEKE